MILPTDNFKKKVNSITRANRALLLNYKMANLIRNELGNVSEFFAMSRVEGSSGGSQDVFTLFGHRSQLQYPEFIALFYVLH